MRGNRTNHNRPITKPRIIEKICRCGCGQKFMQSRYNAGYIKGHSQKITNKGRVPKGNKHWAWKGGVRKHRGYVLVYSPTHPAVKNTPRSPYVKRSRLEMEKKLGRYLKTSEIVHHINGIRDDDRIENLVLTNQFNHKSIHRKGKKLNRTKHCFE